MQELSSDRRGAARIDKVFRVLIASEQHGEVWHVARNISESGMFVEMADPLPLRTRVIVRFSTGEGDGSICAMARVQNHYYLQYADKEGLRALTGVGLRFVRFVAEPGSPTANDRLH